MVKYEFTFFYFYYDKWLQKPSTRHTTADGPYTGQGLYSNGEKISGSFGETTDVVLEQAVNSFKKVRFHSDDEEDVDNVKKAGPQPKKGKIKQQRQAAQQKLKVRAQVCFHGKTGVAICVHAIIPRPR